MISIQDARAEVLARCAPLARSETVDVRELAGRVPLHAVRADTDLPPFDRATMDGYAVHAHDLAAAPVSLPVDGEIAAGAAAEEPLPPGTARAIMTGAPLPPGADAVVQVEWTREAGGRVEVQRAVEAGRNVARAGEDRRAGDEVHPAGLVVPTLAVSLLIGAGAGRVEVRARPRVAVLTSGDELVPPGAPLRRGQIRESNGPALAALLRHTGAEVFDLGVARDTREDLAARLERALEHDVVVLTGGSSVGRYDFSAEVVASFGAEQHFDRVAVKPGKPTIYCTRGDTHVFCLPGNPVAALMTGRVLVAPCVRALLGQAVPAFAAATAPLVGEVRRHAARDLLVPMRRTADGLVFDGWHGSGDLASMARADAFGFIGRGEGLARPGTSVPWFELPRELEW